ncbi:MAG: hypothetical protein ACU0GG_02565 [Paracoccaceae bacterium]
MKMVFLVLGVAMIASLLFGTSLSRVLFEMFFLWWVPAGLILFGALWWIGRDPKRRELRNRDTFPFRDED